MGFPRGEEQVAFIGRPDRRRGRSIHDVVEGHDSGGRPINRGGYYPVLLIIPALLLGIPT